MSDEVAPAPPKMPLWVKVFIGLGIAVVVLAAVVAAFSGGFGGHGPGRHLPGGHSDDASTTPDPNGASAPTPPSGAFQETAGENRVA